MGRVDILTGTLGKALGGASGGYTAASARVVDWLRQRSRPYLFSNTLAPVIAGASLKVFDMLEEDKNEDYRDQIYYALAQIELEELNREQGMDYLRDALAEDSGNRRPRMKSFLALADLHLEDREVLMHLGLKHKNFLLLQF